MNLVSTILLSLNSSLLNFSVIRGPSVAKTLRCLSRSRRRTLLTTPSKNYAIGVVAFSNCKMLVEELSSSP
ncbi:hypothetical protein H5410_032890 [Solanum commersonii]|uniref:Uncharacterized protein n=1 Tax=Solanum commersonii TaxID=4109 RepID=A0A9J5YP69_SOLCO|nr:hypothetical protein H5410_032890 [Solanum commersonii]